MALAKQPDFKRKLASDLAHDDQVFKKDDEESLFWRKAGELGGEKNRAKRDTWKALKWGRIAD